MTAEPMCLRPRHKDTHRSTSSSVGSAERREIPGAGSLITVTDITLYLMSVPVITKVPVVGRWQPDGRGRLEQAALQLFTERGYDQTTTAEIAENPGLTERTFFRHFADKREVLLGARARSRRSSSVTSPWLRTGPYPSTPWPRASTPWPSSSSRSPSAPRPARPSSPPPGAAGARADQARHARRGRRGGPADAGRRRACREPHGASGHRCLQGGVRTVGRGGQSAATGRRHPRVFA